MEWEKMERLLKSNVSKEEIAVFVYISCHMNCNKEQIKNNCKDLSSDPIESIKILEAFTLIKSKDDNHYYV